MIARRLKNLFGSGGDAQPSTSGTAVPEGERLYAIGDVHGRLDLLTELLDTIDADDKSRGEAETRVIMLGDLTDRGPESKGVIEHLITRDWGNKTPVFVKGNHDEVFLLTLAGNLEATRFWTKIGGTETMMSYGVDEELIDSGDTLALSEDFVPRVPDAHVAFLHKMRDSLVVGGYCFVHAGIKPGVPLEKQKPEDLRWIRDSFLDYEGNHGMVVVHGHSISRGVEEMHNRIGIDTGAYATGTLTAIGVEAGQRWFLST